MTESALLSVALWGLTLYVMRRTRQIEATNLVLQGLPSPAPIAWIGKMLYVIIGLSVASAFFVGSALADGADPFNHVQNVIRSVVQTEVPEQVKPTVVYSPTPTGTSLPTPTPTSVPLQTPTLNAVMPSPTILMPTPNDDDKDKTPGWMKTPNGQGQGQFQTPPGQGGTPPGQIDKPTKEPNQPKPTNEPKATNEPKPNNGNGTSKK